MLVISGAWRHHVTFIRPKAVPQPGNEGAKETGRLRYETAITPDSGGRSGVGGVRHGAARTSPLATPNQL